MTATTIIGCLLRMCQYVFSLLIECVCLSMSVYNLFSLLAPKHWPAWFINFVDAYRNLIVQLSHVHGFSIFIGLDTRITAAGQSKMRKSDSQKN